MSARIVSRTGCSGGDLVRPPIKQVWQREFLDTALEHVIPWRTTAEAKEICTTLELDVSDRLYELIEGGMETKSESTWKKVRSARACCADPFAQELLHALPTTHLNKTCQNVIPALRGVDSLQFNRRGRAGRLQCCLREFQFPGLPARSPRTGRDGRKRLEVARKDHRQNQCRLEVVQSFNASTLSKASRQGHFHVHAGAGCRLSYSAGVA